MSVQKRKKSAEHTQHNIASGQKNDQELNAELNAELIQTQEQPAYQQQHDQLHHELLELSLALYEQLLPLRIFVYITLPVLIAYVLYIGKDLFVPMLIAFVFAYLIMSLAESIERALKRWLTIQKASSVSLILSLTFYLSALAGVVWVANDNLKKLIANASFYQDKLKGSMSALSHAFGVESALNWQTLSEQIEVAKILGMISHVFVYVASNGLDIILYTAFLLSGWRNFSKVVSAMCHYKGWSEASYHTIKDSVNNAIHKYLDIKLLVSLMTAVVSFGVMLGFRLDFALFWAILTFILNFIPTLGSIVAALIPSLMAFIQFGPGLTTLSLMGALALTQLIIGNIIEPRMMGHNLNLNTFMILVFLTAWGKLWGLVGMLLCVPIMVVMLIVFKEFETTGLISIALSGDGDIYHKKHKIEHTEDLERLKWLKKKIKRYRGRQE